jgi:hypothetical protein
MCVWGIRGDQKHVGPVQATERALKDDRPIQSERYLCGVVPVSSRGIGRSQHQHTLGPNIELERRHGHRSQFIQVR